jgi:hypothetical protein
MSYDRVSVAGQTYMRTTCDRCGEEREELCFPNQALSLPARWGHVTFTNELPAETFTTSYDLCRDCTRIVCTAIDEAMKR